MTNGKSWSELYPKADPDGGKEYLSRKEHVAFFAAGGGQTPYQLSSVDADIVNAITERGQRHDRNNFVATLKDTPIDYFAPVGVKMQIDRNDMIFSSDTLGSGAVSFEITPGSESIIAGVLVRCSGFFSLSLDESGEMIDEPFTAVPLVVGINTFSIGELRKVYPPGAYIFHLSGSAGITFDMLPEYSVDDAGDPIKQPPGVHKLQIVLMETADPPMYMIWYDDKHKKTSTFDLAGDPKVDRRLRPQKLVTYEALKVILGGIFAGADEDPTGEGDVFLPWKYEQWTLPAVSRNNYDIRKAAVDAVNAATRKQNNGIDNYAGQIIPAPDSKAASLDAYADQNVKFVLEDNTPSDGSKLLTVRLDKTAPVDIMFRILPNNDTGGFRDASIECSGYFQITFHPSNKVDEQLRQKIVEADEITRATTLLLIDGDNMDDKNSIYPPGRYTFRPFDPAGVTVTLFASTTIGGKTYKSDPGSRFAITMLRQTGGDEFYNVWYKETGPSKIINDTDPADQVANLKGMKQVKPVLLKDVGALVGNVQKQVTDLKRRVDALQPVWKIEQWLDAQKNLYFVTYGTDGKIANIASATDATKMLKTLDGMIKVPTLIEEELKTDPDDTPENIASDLRNAMDLMERESGYDNLGEQGKGGTKDKPVIFDIDWRKGKLKKFVLLAGDMTINFTNPPQVPCMFEVFAVESPNATGAVLRGFTSSNTPFTKGASKELTPDSDSARVVKFFYDGKKYYNDHDDF